MAAQTATELPEGPDWVYEVKFDGYRALLIKFGARVELRSRNDKDLTRAYPDVVAAGQKLQADSLILDGEVVALDASGRPSFQALQHRSAHPKHVIVYYAFDLLHLTGEDFTSLPLSARRSKLEPLVRGSGILVSDILGGTAQDVITAVRSLGLEGIIAKRNDSRYIPGERSPAWQKLRLDRPGGNRVDALLVGYYEGKQLRFAGKVRAGFTPNLRRQVFAELEPLHTAKCPFVDLPNSKTTHWGGGVTPEQMVEMRWVKPQLVAQIRFVEWTAEGHLRHAAFLGVRADKRAKEVRRET
jgi:DNA ligase D-like protein (predicted ligase)